MHFDNFLIILFLIFVIMAIIIWLLFHWHWLPIVLLLIVWFIPRQAVPDGLLENYILLRWLTVFIIPLIFIIQLFRSKVVNFVVPHLLIIPLTFLSAVYFLSGLINRVSFIETIGSLLIYLRYPLLFIALLNMNLDLKDVKNFVKLFMFLIILQIPECFYRFYIFNISGDFISFTLGPWGAFDLGVYATYAICMIIAYNIVNGLKLHHIFVMLLFFALAIMGEIKALIFTIPVVSLIIVLYSVKRNILRNRISVMSLIIGVVLVIIYIFQYWGRVHHSGGNMLAYYFQILTDVITNPSRIISPERWRPDDTTRFLGSAFVFEYLKNSIQSIIFGAGPGSLMAGSFTGVSGKLYDLPKYLNQIAVILGEIGVLGLICYLWLLINVFKIIENANALAEDNYSKFISLALMGMWFFYTILGPFYDLVWRHDSPNLIFWFLLAFLHKKQIAKEKYE